MTQQLDNIQVETPQKAGTYKNIFYVTPQQTGFPMLNSKNLSSLRQWSALFRSDIEEKSCKEEISHYFKIRKNKLHLECF